MARGDSGRIVLEIDPSQKDELYEALGRDGVTLKAWFLREAALYLRNRTQIQLFGTAEDAPEYVSPTARKTRKES